MSTVDWAAFTALPWETSPLHLPGDSPPLDPSTTYAAVLAAVAPSRQGARFFALPEVRFHQTHGRVGGPGELLPGPEDGSLKEYLHRVGDKPLLLTVREPLLIDYPLWSTVRRLVEPLWERIGVPVVPVGSELAVSDGVAHKVSRSGYHQLVWVLQGELEVTLASGDVLVGSGGDLLSWPAQAAELKGSGCLWLRLAVPADGSLATGTVTELLLARLQQQRGTDATPYLPRPDVNRPLPPLVETAERLATLSADADVERSLRVQWAKLVSAAALEPVPAPLKAEPLEAGQLVTASAPVVRMRDGDQWLWAMNGHAFTIGGAGDALLNQLASGTVEVRDDGYLPLLRRLHSLRAVEVVGR